MQAEIWRAFLKFQEMLKENEITMVLTVAKPDTICFNSIKISEKQEQAVACNIKVGSRFEKDVNKGTI